MTTMAAITPFQTLLSQSHHPPHKPSLPPLSSPSHQPPSFFSLHRIRIRHRLQLPHRKLTLLRTNSTRNPSSKRNSRRFGDEEDGEIDFGVKKVTQFSLWIMEGVYILWLFLLSYAPGDPVWAISSDTINSLLGLSLNFFYVLPLTNAVGIHVIEAPVIHPMSEGLFNFVIGWTLMFAPLLFTDLKNGRYKGSLDVLWGCQMFLTNTFLIPYMAIRLNKPDEEDNPRKLSRLGTVMIQGAHIVGLIGGFVSLISILWGFFGRAEGDFGSVSQRWDFLLSYLGSERLAYAFIWDIVLYAIFQPWLIGENLANVQENRVVIVKYLRFVPVIGLVAYLVSLNRDEEMYIVNKSLND
ncbi:hypothetical protein RND81_11G059300 [Saponaria officinalis]|uniref:Transmembrane protein n=1 Tax=Saponaria officinalis TaxID=3572 RepID=A0AAW1HIV1_SAPOF